MNSLLKFVEVTDKLIIEQAFQIRKLESQIEGYKELILILEKDIQLMEFHYGQLIKILTETGLLPSETVN